MSKGVVVPVIMAGGVGSRLWPLSRELYPKQFLKLTSDQTMLQETLRRAADISAEKPLILCNEEHRFIVAEQVRQSSLSCKGIILEPSANDTAPAVAMAALNAVADGSDPILLILAADHIVDDISGLVRLVENAKGLAASGKIVTFGIEPTYPETGYGYIKKGSETSTSGAFDIEGFVEKPDQGTAKRYLDTGEYVWNSGMFMFRAGQYLSELEKHSPTIYNACVEAAGERNTDADFIRFNEAAYKAAPKSSIDYAVMEKTTEGVVMPFSGGWSDIGSWAALWDSKEKDVNGCVTEGDVLSIDSQDCYIKSDGRLVTTIGLKDAIVVDTKDAVLIADKNSVQAVKQVTATLKEQGRQEALCHRVVDRPWGQYDLIDSGDRYQVKKITVKPGARLSLQKHFHRAEHWVVVSGTARVTRGDDVFIVSENESTYIPIGETHSLENPGKMPLELVEIQTGSYLGEDDIVRLEDIYGRLKKES